MFQFENKTIGYFDNIISLKEMTKILMLDKLR